MVLQCADDRPGGVAGDDAGGGRLAIAHRARVRVDLHNNVLHAVHLPQRRFKRNPQGNGDMSQPDLCNFHILPPPVLFRKLIHRPRDDLRVLHQPVHLDKFIRLVLSHLVSRENGAEGHHVGHGLGIGPPADALRRVVQARLFLVDPHEGGHQLALRRDIQALLMGLLLHLKACRF
ncbi:hypothetical protein SDC9_150614 [bioreactor metagenome]|uniref:Uncharacterized protein n=1 Tax=bioreactor metagenome TaxID=1076179 RepID=A0A645ESA1_9ZZZZ